MTDRRRANVNWYCAREDGTISTEGATLAVLMDIRDEMREQTRLLITVKNLAQCPNVRRGFVSMHKLRRHLESLFPSVARPKRRRKKRVTVVIRRRKPKKGK